MISFLKEIFFYEFFILHCIRQTERFENIIKIFSLRPLMEEIQAIIPAKNTFDVLILAAVPNYRFGGTFEFLGKSHSKTIKIPQGMTSRDAAHPVSSGICKGIKINNAGAVFSGHDFIPGENPFEIGNFQKINPLEEIKVGKGFVHEFRFRLRFAQLHTHKIAPRIGMLLNGLFDPSRSPAPFLDFFPIPTVFSQFPINGGG